MTTSPDNSEGGVRNWLQEAVDAGFPRAATIPLVPADLDRDLDSQQRFDLGQRGKTPAFMGKGGGWWFLKDWQAQGCPEDKWVLSAECGANAGLRTGVDVGDGRGSYVFVDIDPPTGAEGDDATVLATTFSDTAVAALAEIFGPLWVRRSRPGRAGVLFRVRAGGDPGAKVVYKFMHSRFTRVAKIEYLADGQQVAFGGVHISGRQIEWYHSESGVVRSFPPAAEIVTVASYHDVHEAMGKVSEAMIAAGMDVVAGRERAAGDHSEGEGSDPAPSVPELVRLLDLLPNDHRVPREASEEKHANYVSIMLATVGAARALGASAEEMDAVKTAALNWVCKWEGPNGEVNDWLKEDAKWDNDWTQRDTVLGWQYLNDALQFLGVHDLRTEAAQAAFAAVVAPVPKPVVVEPPKELPDLETLVERKRLQQQQQQTTEPKKVEAPPGTHKAWSALSDIGIADIMQVELAEKFVFVKDEGRWLGLTDRAVWSAGEGDIRDDLQPMLQNHAAKFLMEDRSEETRARIMSKSKVDSLESLMKSRLGKVSSETHLAVEGVRMLQTPVGAFDLVTGARIPRDVQVKCVDTRCTGTVPGPRTATPMFDAVVSHLCNDDVDTINWLWTYLGYMTLGDPKAHVLLILEGPGGNGKGTVCRIMRRILGSYAIEADRRVVLSSGQGDHPTARYDLRYKRMWYIDELPPNEKWNESDLRAMSGGNTIQGRPMNKDFIYFQPEGTLIMATNHIPALFRIDDAIARRFRIIRCNHKVPDDVRRETLEDEIMATEAPAILARVMDEAKWVHSRGYKLPAVSAAMASVTNAYFDENDKFYAWFRRECEADRSGAVVKTEDLKARFERCVKALSDSPETSMGPTMSPAAFFARLVKHGAVGVGGTYGKMITGVRLKISLAAAA